MEDSFFPASSTREKLHRRPARHLESANMRVRAEDNGPPLQSSYSTFTEVINAEDLHDIMSYNVVANKDRLWGNAINQRFSKFKNFVACIKHRSNRLQGAGMERLKNAARMLDEELGGSKKSLKVFATEYRKLHKVDFKSRQAKKVSLLCGIIFLLRLWLTIYSLIFRLQRIVRIHHQHHQHNEHQHNKHQHNQHHQHK